MHGRVCLTARILNIPKLSHTSLIVDDKTCLRRYLKVAYKRYLLEWLGLNDLFNQLKTDSGVCEPIMN